MNSHVLLLKSPNATNQNVSSWHHFSALHNFPHFLPPSLMDVPVSCPHLHTRFYRRLAGSECLSYWHTDHWSAKPSVWAGKQHAASAKRVGSTLNLKAKEWKSRGKVVFQRARKTERATAGQMCSTNKNKLAWSARHEHSGGVFTAVWEGCESDSTCTLHIFQSCKTAPRMLLIPSGCR